MIRYWCKSRNNILDTEGFLRERQIPSEQFFIKEEEIFTWDEISVYKSLVLLGEPGSGKTTAIINELNKDENSLYYNLDEYSDESRLINDLFFSERFNQMKSSENPIILYLDSFDSALTNIRTLPYILKRQLENINEASSYLSLRIICRSGYWIHELDKFLEIYFGKKNHGIFQIAPLLKEDIISLAKREGIDSSIINDIIKQEVQPFAINPVSLKLLFAEYKQNRKLSVSRTQLYENGCRALCAEPNESRQFQNITSSSSVDRKLAIASRIAALMVFCNKSHIDIRQNPPYDERKLTLCDIQEGLEITDKYTFSFTQKDIIETVVNSSIFSYIDDYSYSFYHWSYAEYLAARFVINHEFSIEQIISLITISSDREGMIVEQVKGTASWLSTLSKSLLERSIHQDPLSLFTGDLLSVSNDHKKQLIDSLFEKLSTITITDGDWNLRNHYYKLNHPDLSDQLKPYLENKDNNFLTRRVAIDIIDSCKIQILSKELLTIALDKSEDSYLRKRAIFSLGALGSEEERKLLKPYAIEPQDDDSDDEIKGAALFATFPKITNTAEVFKSLTPIKKESLFGSYRSFLNYLTENIENQSLSDGLNWCKKYPELINEWYSDIKKLNDIIIYQCWKNYNSLDNKPLFAEVILLRLYNHAELFPIPDSYTKKWEPISISEEIRQDVMRQLVQLDSYNKDKIYSVWAGRLIDDTHFNFVLSSYQNEENKSLKMKWALLLRYFEYSDVIRIDAILRLADTNEELKNIFSDWFYTIELDSEVAKKLKDQWEESQKWNKKQETPLEPEIDVQNRLSQRILNFESTQNRAYFTEFFRDLTLTPTSKVYGDILNPDVTEFDAWKNLTESLQSKVLELSITFLDTHDDCYEEWFGQNVLNGIASTGYKCLVLLNKYNQNVLKQFDSKIWEKWSHIILAYPQSIGISRRDQSFKEIIPFAYAKAPDTIINIIKDLIKNGNKEDDSTLFILYKIENIIDENILDVFVELINSGTLYAKPLANLIRYVFKARYAEASQIAKNILEDNRDQKRILVGVEFAKFCNASDWEYLINYIKNDREFSEEFFLKYASDYSIRENPLWQRLGESQIGSLYVLLYNLFPPENDPQFEGAHFVGAREEVSSFRDSLLIYLRNKATLESVSAIEAIKEQIPSDSIKFQLVTAKDNYRKSNWRPLIPTDFLRLSENGQMRVISNNSDLLNLIIESLYRLEDRLQKENSLSFALWDYVKQHEETKKALYKPKKEELLSDFIQDHLLNDIQKYGIMSFREVEIRRANFVHGGETGERTDILVSYYNTRYYEQNKVVIEVKGSWNDGVRESLKNQLVDRYLHSINDAYGLYLIGWFDCEAAYEDYKNNTGADQIEDAKETYEKDAKDLSSEKAVVKSFILDCRMKN